MRLCKVGGEMKRECQPDEVLLPDKVYITSTSVYGGINYIITKHKKSDRYIVCEIYRNYTATYLGAFKPICTPTVGMLPEIFNEIGLRVDGAVEVMDEVAREGSIKEMNAEYDAKGFNDD